MKKCMRSLFLFSYIFYFTFVVYSSENAVQSQFFPKEVIEYMIKISPYCYPDDKDFYEVFKISSYLSRTCKQYKDCFNDVLKAEILSSKEKLSSFNASIVSNYHLSTKVLIFFAHQYELQETQKEKELYQKSFDTLWSYASELREQRMAKLLGHSNKKLFQRDRMRVYRGEFLTYDEQRKAFEYFISKKEEHLAKEVFRANSEIMKEKATELLDTMSYSVSLDMIDFLVKNGADVNNVGCRGTLVAQYAGDYKHSPSEEILKKIEFLLEKGAYHKSYNPLNVNFSGNEGLINFDKFAPLVTLLLKNNYYSSQDKRKLLDTAVSNLNNPTLKALAERQIDYLIAYVPIEKLGICSLLKYGKKNELVKERIAKKNESRTLEQKENLIEVSCDYNNTEILEFLLQEQKYSIPSQLLFDSCLEGKVKIVDILLRNGADRTEKRQVSLDCYGHSKYTLTCLGAACKSGNVELVKLLIERWHMNPNNSAEALSSIKLIIDMEEKYKRSKKAKYCEIFEYLLQKGAFCSLRTIVEIENETMKDIIKKYLPFKARIGLRPEFLLFFALSPFIFGSLLSLDFKNSSFNLTYSVAGFIITCCLAILIDKSKI